MATRGCWVRAGRSGTQVAGWQQNSKARYIWLHPFCPGPLLPTLMALALGCHGRLLVWNKQSRPHAVQVTDI